MFDQIDHVGVAVSDLEATLALFRDTFGMPVVHREVVEDQGVEAALLDVGDSHIELLLPLARIPGGALVAKRGTGLHHVAYRVTNVDETLEQLRRRRAVDR